MKAKVKSSERSNTRFAYALLSPALILLALLIGYPLVYNIVISVQEVPMNPNLPSEFIGAQNFIDVFTDTTFYSSILVTLVFTVIVTVISTVLGLIVAIFLNRKFFGKKIVNSIIILSYVVPSVCLIFTWRYLFNNIYGIINYFVVDVFHLADEAPIWFDMPVSAFILVSIFCIWKFFPYAYMSFNAILQSMDNSLYEAADIDGASSWEKFKAITFPAIKPTMVTVVSLRTIWVFYIYTEVYLLTTQVDVLGVYLYDMAFATHDFGKAAAISIVLFVFIFAFIMLIRKKVLRVEED
ncbi:carbohydrate ABC transporter permease [Claveliimonas bilis]|uniref:carbohydrate ABC transporter permease n=1 Tax=Claveliimonas bilis TaxID=3028070 RepID=UPI00292F792F|nr:sugar ABC transporter permease [Claveliimonas bilis]BDZ80163.1 sugar ABC transporter permease [Claveliimonas bilis]